MPISNPIGGVATGTLLVGEALTVTAQAGAEGRVVLFATAQQSDQFEATTVADGISRAFGPFSSPRYVRVYTPTGNVTAQVAIVVPAVTPLLPAVISEDRLTISGQGAVPDSKVRVFDQDSDVTLGAPVANVVGEWSLTLTASLPDAMRVGYAMQVFGPYATVETPAGSLDFSSSANSGLLLFLF